ncbi:hypothetical protein Droror1_Dr00007276 [Drosera rotundifolia]
MNLTRLFLATFIVLVAFQFADAVSHHGFSHLSSQRPIHAPLAPLPPASLDDQCMNLESDLMDCLDYIEAGVNSTAPTQSCCTGLGQVLKTNPVCVCWALNTTMQMGIPLNLTRAAVLAPVCKLKAPPLSDCHLQVPAPPPAPVTPVAPKLTPAPAPSHHESSGSTLSAKSFAMIALSALVVFSLN